MRALPTLPDARSMTRDFALWTEQWHPHVPAAAREDDLLQQLHLANFTLWHLEDAARDPLSTNSTIADVKRAIDRTNQQRNDLVEQFDSALLELLSQDGLPDPAAPLHSETPGMMADRLSILALKLFHTGEQAHRLDASAAHRERNRQRLAMLQQQSDDLSHCFAELLIAVTQRRRGYRLYRQMKMYNDPELNPVLYRTQPSRSA